VVEVLGIVPLNGVQVYEVEKPDFGPKVEGHKALKSRQWKAIRADGSYEVITIVHRSSFASSELFWWVDSYPASLPRNLEEARIQNQLALDQIEGRAVKKSSGAPSSGQGWGAGLVGATATIAAAFIIGHALRSADGSTSTSISNSSATANATGPPVK